MLVVHSTSWGHRSPPGMQAPTVQETLGLIASRYRPEKRIGSGSFGEIYGGADTNGDKVSSRHHAMLAVHDPRRHHRKHTQHDADGCTRHSILFRGAAQIAIKFERHGHQYPQLRREYTVYRELQGCAGVCKVRLECCRTLLKCLCVA